VGKIADWLYSEWPMFGPIRIRHFAEKAALRSEMMQERYHKELAEDQLAAKTLELESLKKKIVERAQVTPILKAKSAAEIRRVVEQQNEREFEEQANAPFGT
jgi:uncharacterized protein YeaO (DUF488 family)